MNGWKLLGCLLCCASAALFVGLVVGAIYLAGTIKEILSTGV